MTHTFIYYTHNLQNYTFFTLKQRKSTVFIDLARILKDFNEIYTPTSKKIIIQNDFMDKNHQKSFFLLNTRISIF